jgi:predicted PurR-regulated permease PerM
MNRYIKLAIALAVVFLLRDFVIILFISFLLTTAFSPVVEWLKNKKLPRPVSSFLLVVLLIVIPVILVINLGTIIAGEGRSLAGNFPEYLNTIDQRVGINISEELQNRFSDNSNRVFEQLFSLTGSFLRMITSFIILLVITVYWLIFYDETKSAIVKAVTVAFPKVTHARRIFDAVEDRLGSWIKGQLLLGVTVGIMTYLFLRIVGVPYAGTLALFAALLEFIPTLGPIVAAIPAMVIALNTGLNQMLVVAIGYIVIQQLESYLIAPKVLGSTVKLNPFVILMSVIVGAQLLGIIGALIAVPAVLTVQEIVQAYRTYDSRSKH